MSSLLALEWDAAEARVVVAAKHGRRTVIEHALAIPLPARLAEGQRSAAEIGQAIAEGLADCKLSHPEALLAVGRGSVQLRELQLPAVPDDELPDMVRLQAMRELGELDDSWLLDFVPILALADSRTVLAAALPPEAAAQLRAVCEAAGLRVRRMVLRACAAGWLLGRSPAQAPQSPRLLVDLLDDEADLTVVLGGQVLFLRTMRLGKDPVEQILPTEIRRTLAAAENRLSGRRVESLVFCGPGEPQAALAARIQEELGIQTELFDPLGDQDLAEDLLRSPPEHAGRFAPLVGALLAELEGVPQTIDFLHPRRAPPPPNRRRRWIAAASAAAVLLVGYLVYARIAQTWLAADVDRLQKAAESEEKAAVKADKIRQAVAEISKWTDGEVVWLDHLRALGEDFPPTDRAILTQLSCGPAPSGGEMHLRGKARDPDTISQMEQQLRQRSRNVNDHGSHEDASKRPYSWQFDTSVLVGREPGP
jgi:Tfp pilus assembly PilM family ATPase